MDREERAERAALLEAEQADETRRCLDPVSNHWGATDVPDLRETSPEVFKNGESACRLLESSIKDSYYKAHRTVDLQRRSNSDMYEAIVRTPKVALSKASHKNDPFFGMLEENSVYLPKGESALRAGGSAYGGGADRFSSEALSERYAAPATSLDKPYYSRRTTGDPDYYDYDLEASVNQFKKATRYVPPNHDAKEIKTVNDLARTSGMESVSSRMFMDGNNPATASSDPRYATSSYLSCALRTPDFWTRRFENLLSESSAAGSKANEYKRESAYVPRKYPWELREEQRGDQYKPLLAGKTESCGSDSDSDGEPFRLKPSPAAQAAAARAIARHAQEEAIETAAMVTPSKTRPPPPPQEPQDDSD